MLELLFQKYPVISGAGIVGVIFGTPMFIESLALFETGGLGAVLGVFLVPMAAASVISCAIAVVGEITYFINGNVYNVQKARYKGTEGWQIKVVHNDFKPPPNLYMRHAE